MHPRFWVKGAQLLCALNLPCCWFSAALLVYLCYMPCCWTAFAVARGSWVQRMCPGWVSIVVVTWCVSCVSLVVMNLLSSITCARPCVFFTFRNVVLLAWCDTALPHVLTTLAPGYTSMTVAIGASAWTVWAQNSLCTSVGRGFAHVP